MINVVGLEDGPESEAARTLAEIIANAWPNAKTDSAFDIHIISSVQCHGESPRDIDIVLLAKFPPESRFYANSYVQKKCEGSGIVFAISLCVLIEVKDHDPSLVRFTGPNVEVAYRRGRECSWESATQQSEKQKYSLKSYLERQGMKAPFIINLVWLRNVHWHDLPRLPHNILGSRFTWNGFLNTVAQSVSLFKDGNKWLINSFSEDWSPSFSGLVKLLTAKVKPTRLDRLRMDRICQEKLTKEGSMDDLGKRQIILMGWGGTGKTIMLLQMAWRLCEGGGRVLILTYNRALVADLRRLMTFMHIPDDIIERGIRIETLHSFLHGVLSGLGIIRKDEDYFKVFRECKQELLSSYNRGALRPQDILKLKDSAPYDLKWDYVFVDEAQDCPDDERDILRLIYPIECFALADGRQQLVRIDRNCDWTDGLQSSQYSRVILEKCLRMKSNLVGFVNALVRELGYAELELKASEEAIGGRVIIIEGDYFSLPHLHDDILARNSEDGNCPVDILVCVPPTLVQHEANGRVATPAIMFRNLGQEVWDGTSDYLRGGYPTSIRQLRIVQYDSCRGLEGWVAMNLAFDQFYEYKCQTWRPPDGRNAGTFPDDPELPKRFAARWIMIPLTRAIDTLVIEVGIQSSIVKDALRKVAERHRDFTEWYN